MAWVLADALLEKFGGDSLTELLEHVEGTRRLWRELLSRRPRPA